MVIAEKMAAAARIAAALDDAGTPRRLHEGGVAYFEAKRRGERIFVVSASGHLYAVTAERTGSFYYPVFNVVWRPLYAVKRLAKGVEQWIQVISHIAEGASTLVSGTDFDVEGELIGYTILKYACGGREGEAKRMAFSTLTAVELRAAFERLAPTINFGLAAAGETRHLVDFLWGVNLSRAITLATKAQSGQYHVLSVGRVQAPTLKFIVDREKAIHSFVPTPFWEVTATIEVDNALCSARYERSRLPRLSEARAVVARCQGRAAFVDDIQIQTLQQAPPVPFDVGGLQGEAYRLFRVAPSQTLSLAERLYLDALISYPRTASQKLPSTIDYRGILAALSRSTSYRKLAEALLSQPHLTPHEGPRSDPAHPAIYPTGNLPETPLPLSSRRIFDLIVRRFLAVFSEPAVKQRMKASIKVDGDHFYLQGRRVLEQGWLKFYAPYGTSDDVILPAMTAGQRLLLRAVRLEEEYTSPPTRYNPASLLNRMEDQGIGTKATRASIIDTLYRRGYVRGERMEATDLGFQVVDALAAYCPAILSVALTKELEGDMAKVEEGVIQRDVVVERVVNVLKDVLLDFRANEGLIGRALSDAVREVRSAASVVGRCPVCGSGSLLILRSRKTGKRFVGCSNFRRGLCDASFPLPQPPYAVTPVRTACSNCGWPRVQVRSRRRRPWYLCLNPDCPTKSRR
jgi:DNA topoisomerase-1